MINQPDDKINKVNQELKTDLERSKLVKIIEDGNIPKFLLDTNIILAYLNQNEQFHVEAKTAIEGLKAKKAWFMIPYLVVGEFLARRNLIGGKNYSIKDALKVLDKFDTGLKNRLVGGTPLNLQNIISFYKKHSRHSKLTGAGFNDFVILAEAVDINNIRILTCDKRMYICGKTIFKDRVYYLPNNTKSIRSDYPRLMSDIQNNFKLNADL